MNDGKINPGWEVGGLPRWCSGKDSPANAENARFNPWVVKMPWSMKWQPTLLFLPGKFHRQKSLAGYSPQCRKELDTTEQVNN